MKALFVTSETNDVDSLVRAWSCWQPGKFVRVTFPHMGRPKDDEILAAARILSPDVIFYIGACNAPGNPSVETFLALQDFAPSVNLCCDAGDWPWHEPLRYYRTAGCFDLQVTLDGSDEAPVDLVTVTPVDPSPYTQFVPRTIRCGFSGTSSFVPTEDRSFFRTTFLNRKASKLTKSRPANALPVWTPMGKRPMTKPLRSHTTRDQVVWDLEGAVKSSDDLITVRRRTSKTPYSEHAVFLMSCRLVINTSQTGSGRSHHIKGRVLEAGWAGCALLESAGSPIAEWLPEGSFFMYRDVKDAKRLISNLKDDEISASANMLSRHVRENYHPRQIYGEILERIGLVDHPVAVSAT